MNIHNDLKTVSFDPNAGTNVADEVILKQVAENIRRQLPQVMRHQPNPNTIALVCGGPSLETTKKELVEAYWNGAKIVAVNGAYQWCIDNNLKPSIMIMLDAREFNARFVETDVPGCHYLLAAQCHPKVFDTCKDRKVTLWHCLSAGDAELELIAEYYFKRANTLSLGTTVGIRAIQLLELLGFKSIEVFGLDSCWLGDDHHGYQQKENEADKRMITWLRPMGREDLWCSFVCAPWHMRQAADFQNLVAKYGNQVRLNVHGDGLIAAILRISAELGSSPITAMMSPDET
jgi:hypothetical protein